MKMSKGIENTNIALGGLAEAFKDSDKRCVYLIDNTGNAQVFFKYKARFIDIPSIMMEANFGQKTKEQAVEEIRVHLTYGIKSGEAVIFHLGEMNLDVQEFLKGQSFWNPKQLFQSPKQMNANWYRENVMKPTDKDPFGGEGTLYPSDEFIIFVSLTKNIPFEDISFLKGLQGNFKGITIN